MHFVYFTSFEEKYDSKKLKELETHDAVATICFVIWFLKPVSRFFTPIYLTPYHLTPIYSPLYHLTPLSFHPDFNLL